MQVTHPPMVHSCAIYGMTMPNEKRLGPNTKPCRKLIVKTGSNSSTAKHSATGVSDTGPDLN